MITQLMILQMMGFVVLLVCIGTMISNDVAPVVTSTTTITGGGEGGGGGEEKGEDDRHEDVMYANERKEEEAGVDLMDRDGGLRQRRTRRATTAGRR